MTHRGPFQPLIFCEDWGSCSDSAAITEGSDGHSLPASPKSPSGVAGPLFWVRNVSNLLWTRAHSSLLGKKKRCQLFFEAGGLEVAWHAGYAQNAESYLAAKHRTLQAAREVDFCFTPPAPRALWSKHWVFSLDEWIFLSLLVKHPLAHVLVSGARGTGSPSNPLRAISSNVAAFPLPSYHHKTVTGSCTDYKSTFLFLPL